MTSYIFLGLTHKYLNVQYITLIMYIFLFVLLIMYVSLPDGASNVCMMSLHNCNTNIHRPLDLNIPSWFSCEWVSQGPCWHNQHNCNVIVIGHLT